MVDPTRTGIQLFLRVHQISKTSLHTTPMTFIPPGFEQTEQDAAPVSLEDFHIWRSKFVEKCARAERHVLTLLRTTNGTWSPKTLLSQKMDDLRKMLAQSPCAVRVAKVEKLLDELTPHSRLRSELVHSTMTIAEVEGSPVVVLRPADEPRLAEGKRTILTLDQLKQSCQKLNDIANALGHHSAEAEKRASQPTLKSEINPPSSPPRPKPGAGDGP